MQQFLEETIREAGKFVLEHYGKSHVSHTKRNETDIVTDVDVVVNTVIVEKIKAAFPDHGIQSEEAPQYQPDAAYQWIIDPIDGTINFFRRTPLFAVSIAIAKDNELIHAAIYDPVHDILYSAEKGKGALENGVKTHTSTLPSLQNSFGCYPSKLSRTSHDLFHKLVPQVYDKNVWFTAFSSATISATQVASGKRDWFLSLAPKVWDLAAAALILSEAGCAVTNLEGTPWRLSDTSGMLAANPDIHRELLAILQS